MKSRTVIIGAGFAGRQACRALARADTELLLLDPNDYTVMLPALPDLAGGWVPEPILHRPLNELLPANVRHIQEKADTIDLDHQTVTTTAGNSLSFDHLLICGGSVVDFHDFNQHLDSIFQLDSLESALRIRDAFPQYLAQAQAPHLVIAGGGYTGLELAASLLFHSIRNGTPCRVTVADPSDKVLPFLSKTEHRRITSFLDQSGIDILYRSKVTAFDGTNVHVDETVIPDAFFCWAGGSKLSIPAIKGEVSQLRDGRLTVSPDLSLPSHPNVFAAGDSAAFIDRGNPLRKAINFAWYEGARAGKNIAARIQGRPTKPFRPIDPGWVIPLHDQSTGNLFSHLTVYGTLGLRLHYFMCGLRNFSLTNFLQFTKISLTLFEKETSPMKIKTILFNTAPDANPGTLILRLFIGTAMMTHGFPKMFGGLEGFTNFVASLGVPAPQVMAFLAAFSESFGALLLLIGLLTRPIAFMLVCTMGVAAFGAHGADGFEAQEKALLYLVPALFFLLKGAGKWSLDAWITRK